MNEFHIPVLLNPCIEGLRLDPGGNYVDATFGGGGHAFEILKRLDKGKLFAFDQDEEAAKNIVQDDKLVFIHSNFRYVRNFMHYYGIDKLDGILADLGVSSHDFDESERGFSFRFDAPLDMRMNRRSGLTAAHIVNSYDKEKLIFLFKNYGEITDAGRLASAIISARSEGEIRTTGEFIRAISKLMPKMGEKKYLARVFQSLRMEVNDELGALTEFLSASGDLLKPGGRMVVVTYHSLEDRLVKNFFRSGNTEGKREQDFYGNFISPFRLINRKVIVPGEDEIRINPRSRSAKLRIAEKTEQKNG